MGNICASMTALQIKRQTKHGSNLGQNKGEVLECRRSLQVRSPHLSSVTIQRSAGHCTSPAGNSPVLRTAGPDRGCTYTNHPVFANRNVACRPMPIDVSHVSRSSTFNSSANVSSSSKLEADRLTQRSSNYGHFVFDVGLPRQRFFRRNKSMFSTEIEPAQGPPTKLTILYFLQTNSEVILTKTPSHLKIKFEV